MVGTTEKQKILIVDDKKDHIERIAKKLREAGYSVAYAKSDKEAFDNIESEGYDLILLDVCLEKEDTGLELCRKLKENDFFKEIPILMMSVYKDKVFQVQKVFEAGAEGFISKDTDYTNLLVWVKTLLLFRKLYQATNRNEHRIIKLEAEVERLRQKV